MFVPSCPVPCPFVWPPSSDGSFDGFPFFYFLTFSTYLEGNCSPSFFMTLFDGVLQIMLYDDFF